MSTGGETATRTEPVPDPGAGDSNRRRWIALVVLCVGQLMIVLDATVVNVALPSIQKELHFTTSSLAWVINAYLITFGGLLLLAGRVGDLVGPKKVFMTGVSLFTAASIFCGLAQTQVELIVARFVQGAGAAVVAATILGILVTIFTGPREKARAMGVYAFVASAGGAIGLLVGGALTQALSWHWIFFINVPIGIVTLVLGSFLIHERPGRGLRNGVDVLGAVLVTASAMLLVYAIVEASTYGWLTLRTLGVGGVALVLLGLFVWLESRLDKPIVPLRMFRSRNTTGATVVRLLFPIGMFGNFFIGALYFQHILGYSPVATGLAFLPMNLLIALFSLLLTARVMNRIGARNTLIPGLALVFLGLMVFVFLPVHASYVTQVLPGMVLFGAGAGLAFSPSVALAMHDAAPEDTGLASGLANTSIQLGAAIGVALLASLSETRTASLLAAGVHPDDALVSGYHLAYLIAAGCMAVATVVAVVIFRDRTIGRTLTTEEQATAAMLEPEIGL